jgi:integrase
MASIEHRVRGSVESWRVVWRQEIDGQRRKQQRSFTAATPDMRATAAAEAVQFRLKVEAYGNEWPPGFAPPEIQPPAALTFGQWAEKAIDRRTRASARTKNDYRRDVRTHMAELADVPLEQIDGGHVAAWLDGRRSAVGADEEPLLSPKTIRNLHGFASSLFVDALAQHPPLVSHNPFARGLGDTGSVHTEDMVFLTPGEFASVLRWVRVEYRDLIRLLFGTGLRFSEATALQVRDVELLGKRKSLTVTKAWKRTDGAGWFVGEPKTKRSRRTISLSDELVEMLIPLVATRRGDELLFPGAGGGRLPATEVYKRGWAPAVARANVCDACYEPQRTRRARKAVERPRIPAPCDHLGVLGKTPRIHDLRHSHVAALISDSESVRLEAISRRLGHSSITITFDRYGHLDPALDDAINAAVDRTLGRPEPAPVD